MVRSSKDEEKKEEDEKPVVVEIVKKKEKVMSKGQRALRGESRALGYTHNFQHVCHTPDFSCADAGRADPSHLAPEFCSIHSTITYTQHIGVASSCRVYRALNITPASASSIASAAPPARNRVFEPTRTSCFPLSSRLQINGRTGKTTDFRTNIHMLETSLAKKQTSLLMRVARGVNAQRKQSTKATLVTIAAQYYPAALSALTHIDDAKEVAAAVAEAAEMAAAAAKAAKEAAAAAAKAAAREAALQKATIGRWCDCALLCGRSVVFSSVSFSRWCERSCDVQLCSLLRCSLDGAIALVTFSCVLLCTLRTQISQSIYKLRTLYSRRGQAVKGGR
jgi:hypothetical protein